ncbi:helix-turn-helix transcriptional regulator [Drancourtella massiliensis]|uniref:Helix-turn-helix transcriptional regulator n=2 Tax=Drancourtella massiliensis TaxID=1632013 RepID=A0ABS2EGN0_9FIRM|nr:helix-turn-helix transcriptional regulator [Drancourtella massiliensis]
MTYKGISFRKELLIDQLFSLHYFEYMSTFSFPGESHNFWEFVCVDKGEVTIGAGDQIYTLKKGDIAFHEPNEFHWVKANGSIAPNLIVISFSSKSPIMNFFRKKILRTDDFARSLLARIITEAGNFLEGRLDDPYQTVLRPKSSQPPASGQLIQLYLEELMIYFYRKYSDLSTPADEKPDKPDKPDKTMKENIDTEVFNRVVAYLGQHLSGRVTIETICKDNLIGRSQLQKIFSKKSGLGIIEYFSNMKIEAAKELIRTEQMNFTQISEKLGYTSIHYFSRQFKKVTGMTPSEYASSIKAMADRSHRPQPDQDSE